MQFDPPVERLNTEVKLCVLTPSLVVPLPSPNHGYCEDCGWRRALHKATSSASSSTQDSAGVTVDEHISQFQPLLQVLSAVNQHVQDAVDTCDLKKDDMDQMANLLVDNPAGLVINISVFNELKLGSRVDFDQGMLQYSKVYARGFFGVVWFVVKKWLVDKSNSVILGAPGTGKSTTVWLLCVFLALTDEMEFYYRRRIGGEDHVFILTKDHFKYYETVDAAGNVETWLKKHSKKGRYVSDGIKLHDTRSVPHLVVTSGTKLASDETDSFYKKVLTVNPWSLDELQEANTAGMNFPNVEECFLNVGGSIRHIREGLAACTRWSSGVIHRIGSAESNATIAALIAVDGSDRIARQFVQKDAICTESFVRIVDSRVLYKALLEKRSDLLVGGSVDKLLKVGKNIGGAFYGHVFELWVHTQVKKYLSFKLKLRLDDADGNQVYQVEEFEFSQFRTVNPSDPKSKRTSIHDELKKSINTDGVFSVPGMSNYPTSDSFATPFLEKKQQSLLLQITIATTHSFGIVDAMETLTCIGKLTYSKPMFVFLVPDADLDNFIIHEDAKTQNVTENFRVSVASIAFDKVKKRRHAFISHSDTE